MDIFDIFGPDNNLFDNNVAQNQSTPWHIFGYQHRLCHNVCADINLLGFYYLGDIGHSSGLVI